MDFIQKQWTNGRERQREQRRTERQTEKGQRRVKTGFFRPPSPRTNHHCKRLVRGKEKKECAEERERE
jgi:hypothetical protein